MLGIVWPVVVVVAVDVVFLLVEAPSTSGGYEIKLYGEKCEITKTTFEFFGAQDRSLNTSQRRKGGGVVRVRTRGRECVNKVLHYYECPFFVGLCLIELLCNLFIHGPA